MATIGSTAPPRSSSAELTKRIPRRRRSHAARKKVSGIAASATGRSPTSTSAKAKATKPNTPANTSSTPM